MVHRAVMTDKTCDHARILVQDPKTHMWSGPLAGDDNTLAEAWRRKCGCIRTSDKLKNILGSFPSPPPPTPLAKHSTSKSWQVIGELVQLVQLSVTATALALYYLIYCYMQLVYYTLRSALYFHNADGPMKITIGVVTLTSLIIGFNLMLRMERILGILY
ncbi:uncharacterized protein LOC118281925 isoform X2 [Spodoptera frugiperda]|uniref:Uncharacterized protein LOC118281925 isoform X2 n=1 Tax=Spodoptera frugiperda TaxID=7108 RepID=A0A9R0DKE7_SPOFR|nr:uncharacterized protein LOC118281925 isoform X2 [Spodoptera frugiperda]